ncbi:uncharacterized protein BDCG_03956 [Blastomyces dermatitidis ER-3]|uniref:Uncharacterized protein n=1 Tax=Ajellomyces dermatitidis (strain ER-3 / ATCC MYA-2586) TaxID=559297 RepID=A0ABP2EXG0_AJEDR|nr:uncharacterized protein BDCG_03956 [Blastomyces dermatitidis ER-3]EEQ88836.2 hypothetical protein BDCG_03956 [Blastomyces dermatitidis ER-3]
MDAMKKTKKNNNRSKGMKEEDAERQRWSWRLNKITKQPIQVQGIPVIYSAGDNDKSLKEFQPDLSRLVSNVAGLICAQSGPVPRFRLTGTKRRKAGLG